MKQLVFYILIFSLVACNKNNDDCVKGNGSETSETRVPGSFSAVSILDKFETHVYQSNDQRIEIHCGKNVIGKIKTIVRNDTLFISNANVCNFVRGYKREIRIDIFAPRIQYMVNEAVGVVRFDSYFKQDSISVRVANSGDFYLDGDFKAIKTSSSGNGDMYVQGTTDRLFVFTTGINFVNTTQLKVRQYMFVHTVSIGDCSVNADSTVEFNYHLQGDGNLYYSGNPLKAGGSIDSTAKGHLIHNN